MSGPRVGLFCGYLDPTRDGVADYTRRLAVHLGNAGFDPLVVTTHKLSRSAGEGTAGVTERWDARGVVAAARAVRRMELDLVHVQFAPSVFGFTRAVGLLPVFLPRRVPLVMTLHEYGVWAGHGRGGRMRSALWSAAEARGYVDRETLLLTPRADYLMVPSPEHLDVLRARFPGRAPPVLEVPIGLNVEAPTGFDHEAPTGDSSRDRADVRRRLGAGPDAPLVVFFGFLHPEKGLDLLIAALAAVRAKRPGTRLLLIGGEESHSVAGAAASRLRRELESVAAGAGVRDRVHFTGYLPEQEVARLLRVADVAAFPFPAGVTRKSGSLLAALAAGVPVVATARPGELLAPTESDGVLRVPPRDFGALAAALIAVLGDRALSDRLTTAGRAAVARHSWAAVSAAHAEVYHRALASTGRPMVDTSSGSEQGERPDGKGRRDANGTAEPGGAG